MPTSAARLLLLVAAATAVPAAPAAAIAHDHWEKSYRIARRATLHLQTDDGDVRVRTWDQRAIAVRVGTTGWRIGERGVRIVERQEGDRVALEVRTPRIEIYFGIVVRALHIDVWVPRESDLTLESGDGDLTVPLVDGALSVRSGDGRITVDGARGRMHLRSGDGSIIGTSLDGDLDAGSGDGRIHVDGRFDGLTLSTRDGGITAEALPGSRLAAAWSLSTGDGRVTLRLPRDLRADLDAHTGDGTIDIELPLTLAGRASRHEVRGALNGGGPPLRLRSGDGSIRIEGR